MMEVMDRLEEMMFGYEELLTCLDLLETAKQPYCILTLFLALIAHEIGIEPMLTAAAAAVQNSRLPLFLSMTAALSVSAVSIAVICV